MRTLPLVLACVLACSSDGGGEAKDNFPACDTEGEFELNDAVGLDTVSVDAHRVEDAMGRVEYTIIVHGSDVAPTQITIYFKGVPVEGMEYEITEAVVNDQPFIAIYPMNDETPGLVTGTLTFTQLATRSDETLGFDLRLELTTGILEGCIRTSLYATGGETGTDTGAVDSTG